MPTTLRQMYRTRQSSHNHTHRPPLGLGHLVIQWHTRRPCLQRGDSTTRGIYIPVALLRVQSAQVETANPKKQKAHVKGRTTQFAYSTR